VNAMWTRATMVIGCRRLLPPKPYRSAHTTHTQHKDGGLLVRVGMSLCMLCAQEP
jgi:hypothetical protein